MNTILGLPLGNFIIKKFNIYLISSLKLIYKDQYKLIAILSWKLYMEVLFCNNSPTYREDSLLEVEYICKSQEIE